MKREFYYPSRDGVTQIHAIEWIPKGEVTAVLQMCHGMVEYIDRYHEFADFLTKHGVYVVGHDHLGHGKSVISQEKLGFFHETDGNAYVIADIQQLRMQTEKKYPGVPYFIMGHSMGSFLVRQYLGLYSGGLSGAIIMGTGEQPSLVVNAGKLVCKIIAARKGWDYRSKFVNNLAVGAYEKKMGAAWLSKNPENVKKYHEDPLCGFIFTVNAYYHMFSGIAKMNQQEKEGKAAKTLPLLFIAGKDDPVGNYGKGVENVYRKYKKCGYQDVELKLYEEDRHEILNEEDKDVVFQDILTWLEIRK
ncbi:MAG: lysophospholipase [Tyzzerella sp.]|nr:lysophospholipase [Tyzzerella sp.]